MIFFHLSDLHIGKQLHHYSLIEEQRNLLHQIAEHVKKEQPDVLIVAGDIYDMPLPSAEAVSVLNDFLCELDSLEQKLTICMIAGNHDSGRRLDYASQILKKHAIYIVGMPPMTETEKMQTVTIKDAFGEVIIYLLPFVKPAFVRKVFPEETLSYSEAVTRLIERESIDETKRNILVSHQFYAGGKELPITSDSENHAVGGIDNVSVDILKKFDYAALGHLHRFQKIAEETAWYCGTMFPYSVSEGEEERFVTMIELGEKGTLPVHKKLPLKLPRKVRKITGTLEECMALAGTEVCHDYVCLTLTDEVETYQPKELLEEKYDHILEIKIDNARTRKLLELRELEQEQLTPYEAFCHFFQEINGRKLTDEEDALLKIVIQEGDELV